MLLLYFLVGVGTVAFFDYALRLVLDKDSAK